MRADGLIVFVALAALAGGCGTTQIRTSDPNARIYVDGRAVGRGHVEITRRGLPHTASITVVAEDGRSARLDVDRGVTGTTIVGAVFLGFVGFFTLWELPEDIFVPVPAAVWGDDGADDVWSHPPAWARSRR